MAPAGSKYSVNLKFPLCCTLDTHGDNRRCRHFNDRNEWTLIHGGISLTSIFGRGAEHGVNFQITVLKVLEGHPDGHASLAELKHYVTVLTCSGTDWSQRMKRLAARAPDLDIFSSGYVLRERSGWQITNRGREFLVSIETSLSAEPAKTPVTFAAPAIFEAPDLPPNVVQLVGHRVQRRRRRAAA